jgi:hypothetical protein
MCHEDKTMASKATQRDQRDLGACNDYNIKPGRYFAILCIGSKAKGLPKSPKQSVEFKPGSRYFGGVQRYGRTPETIIFAYHLSGHGIFNWTASCFRRS